MRLVGVLVIGIIIVAAGYLLVKPTAFSGSWDDIVATKPDGFTLKYDRPEVTNAPFQDASGQERTLADWRGKVVLVNLWATWCAPCVHEMPSLDRLNSLLPNEDFVVLPISMDRAGAQVVEPFLAKLETESLPVLVDPSSRIALNIGAPGLPTTLILDRQGREIGRKVAPARWDDPDYIAFFQAVIDSGF